ncbi:MAG: response regulator [Bryobacteraceae bacterium]|nr:response regulator [Bryobacteraceae bacterium]
MEGILPTQIDESSSPDFGMQTPEWALRQASERTAAAVNPAEEMRHLKGQFLTSLNHEIRTPLTGILGMTDLMAETTLTPEQREYLDITRACADTLYDILSATLEFAALSAGNTRAEQSPFQVVRAVDAMAAEFEAKARAKGLEFALRMDRSLPELVLGDEVRFRRLVSQLLANATKFTAIGRVSLSVRRLRGLGESRERLEVVVADTGIGIAPDMVERIFESFEQLEGGLSRQYQGLGLGLSLVRELTRLLGGEITVESAVGKGSTFTVRLPLLAADENLGTPATRNLRQGKPRILLVEDNKVSQMIVVHMLERNEFEADCADSGMAALRAASSNRYDLVLMDLQMPGMDGFEATHRLRRLPGYEAVPILALTANSSSEFYELCRKHGMQAFLSKPVQPQELILTVKQFLAA